MYITKNIYKWQAYLTMKNNMNIFYVYIHVRMHMIWCTVRYQLKYAATGRMLGIPDMG